MLNQDTIAELERTLSKNRLSYWTTAAGGNHERAVLLHQRNTLTAAVLFADLQVLEIVLRNAIDSELAKQYAPVDWMRHPPLGTHRKSSKPGNKQDSCMIVLFQHHMTKF
jgi:hypothetical protein